jgi:hypothetical protein
VTFILFQRKTSAMTKSYLNPSALLTDFSRRLSPFLLLTFLLFWLVLSGRSYAGEFLITAPDKCENGAVCPITIDISPPLVEGDSFVVAIDGKEASVVKVLAGDLRSFSSRYITPVGSARIGVSCLACERKAAEQIVVTSVSRRLSTSNSIPKDIRVRSRGGDFRVLVTNEDTVSGFAFFDTQTTKVLVKHTPLTAKNPYYSIKGSFADGNHCFGFQAAALLVQCTAGSRSLSIPPTELASLSQQQMGGYISSAPPQNSLPVPEVQAPRQAEPARSSLSLSAIASQPDANGVVTLTITTNSDTASLKVNGDEAGSRADGRYAVKRFAQVGENRFEVIATDRFGNTQRQTVSVNREFVQTAPTIPVLNPLAVRAVKQRDAVAVVIGIEKYRSVSAADFANRDASIFVDYATRALGIPRENIRLLLDEKAGAAEILLTFKNWLPTRIKRGSTDVYVFYSGHGLPSEDGSSLFFLPHEANRDLLERTAISQNELVAAIQKSSPKSVTMFIDSCYSGQSRTGETLLASARPISIVAKETSSFPQTSL